MALQQNNLASKYPSLAKRFGAPQVGAQPEADGSHGFIADVGDTLAGGVIDYVEMVGRAGRAIPGGEEAGSLERGGLVGPTIKWAEDYKAANPNLDHQDREGLPRWFHEGLRSVVTSSVSSLPGLVVGGKTGAAAGSLFGPAGTVVGGVLGAATGAAITGGGLFGMAEYDSVLEEAEAAGVPREEAEPAAILAAAAETGFEGLSNFITVMTLGSSRLVTASGKAALKQGVRTYLKGSLKNLLKKQAVVSTAEVSTEVATGAVQTQARANIGLTDQKAIDGAAQAFGPAFVASLFFGSAGHLYSAQQRRSIGRVLKDPEAKVTDRMQAVEEVAKSIDKTSPEVAKNWRVYAGLAVADGQAIGLDENLYEVQERIGRLKQNAKASPKAAENLKKAEAEAEELRHQDLKTAPVADEELGTEAPVAEEEVVGQEPIDAEILDLDTKISRLEKLTSVQKNRTAAKKNLTSARKRRDGLLKTREESITREVDALINKLSTATGETSYSPTELALQQERSEQIDSGLQAIQQKARR